MNTIKKWWDAKYSQKMLSKQLGKLMIGAVLSAIILPSSANAHAEIVAANPAINSVISKIPNIIKIQANEGVTFEANNFQLLDSMGKVLLSNKSAISSNSIEVQTSKKYSNGYYVVRYKIESADGHIVLGSYGFIVGKVKQAIVKSKDVILESLDVQDESSSSKVLNVKLKPLKDGRVEVSCLGEHLECQIQFTSPKYKAPFVVSVEVNKSKILVLPPKNTYSLTALLRVSQFKQVYYQGKVSL
jgi:methionine-rich copper-binding protein CopC